MNVSAPSKKKNPLLPAENGFKEKLLDSSKQLEQEPTAKKPKFSEFKIIDEVSAFQDVLRSSESRLKAMRNEGKTLEKKARENFEKATQRELKRLKKAGKEKTEEKKGKRKKNSKEEECTWDKKHKESGELAD